VLQVFYGFFYVFLAVGVVFISFLSAYLGTIFLFKHCLLK